MFGGLNIGTLLKTVPQSKIDEALQFINLLISEKLKNVDAKEGETAAALIVDAGDNCMVNIVTLDNNLSIVEMKERFSVKELINNIVETLKNGHQ